MLNAKHRLLQLSVYHHAVRADDDMIENDFVIRIVQGRQPMREPCDLIRFTRACTVLQKIIQTAAMLLYISEQFPHDIQLMIARKDHRLILLYLAVRIFFFTDLDKHELAKDLQQAVLLQDIIPHIMHAVIVLQYRIPSTDLYPFPAAHVEGQEEGAAAAEPGTHIDLLQIHGKIDQSAGLPQKEAILRTTLHAILIDGILIRLSRRIALQLQGDDSQSIQEYDKIHAFAVARPDLFRNGEDVLMVQSVEFLVEGRCRLRIHQIQMNICQLHAMLQHIQTAAASPRFLLIDESHKGIFHCPFIDFAKRLHLLRLRILKEIEQRLAVHGKKTVKLRRRSFYIAAFRLYKLVNDITLILFFRKDVIH